MLAEIIGIDRDVAIAFMLGIIVGAFIVSYIYEKKIKEIEKKFEEDVFINFTSEHG